MKMRTTGKLALAAVLLLCVVPASTVQVVVEGRVVDAAGHPVAGADVVVVGQPDPMPAAGYGEDWTRSETLLRTNAQGGFRLQGIRWAYLCSAFAEGHAPAVAYFPREEVMAGTARVTLTLSSPRAVAGRVLGTDGAPITGAAVELEACQVEIEGKPTYLDLAERFRDRLSTQTDPEGRYRIQGAPAALVRLRVRHPDFLDTLVEERGGIFDARLQPGCRIRGRLLDGDRGLPGWRVRAQSATNVYRFSEFATTGADGSFLLTSLEPGKWDVLAQVPPGAEKTVPSTAVDVGEDVREAAVVLRAEAGGIVEGRVVDAKTRAPVPGIQVRVCGPHTPRDLSEQYVCSDPEGRFRLRLPAGRNTLLTFGMPEIHQGLPSQPVEVRPGERVAVEIPIETGVRLRGRVLGVDGKPAAGAVVRVQGGGITRRLVSAADGSFETLHVAEREVRVTVERDSEGLSVPLQLKPPFPDPLELRLETIPTITLEGRVVDERGRPVAGAKLGMIHMRRSEGREEWDYPLWLSHQEPTRELVTGKDGVYRMTTHDLTGEYYAYLDPGTYRTLSGGVPSGADAVRRFSDLVVLTHHQAITGRVVDTRGRPVEGAAVCWPFGRPGHAATTDADGRFHLSGLPEGPINLVARHGKRAAAFARVRAGGSEVTLTLKGE